MRENDFWLYNMTDFRRFIKAVTRQGSLSIAESMLRAEVSEQIIYTSFLLETTDESRYRRVHVEDSEVFRCNPQITRRGHGFGSFPWKADCACLGDYIFGDLGQAGLWGNRLHQDPRFLVDHVP